MLTPKLSFAGKEQVTRNMRVTAKNFPREAGRAGRYVLEQEMTESKRRVPVKYGNLRATGTVEGPEIRGNSVSFRLSYGDDTVDYAVYVHEDLEAFHPVGEAKFLQSVLQEGSPHYAQRIADQINLERAMKGA